MCSFCSTNLLKLLVIKLQHYMLILNINTMCRDFLFAFSNLYLKTWVRCLIYKQRTSFISWLCSTISSLPSVTVGMRCQFTPKEWLKPKILTLLLARTGAGDAAYLLVGINTGIALWKTEFQGYVSCKENFKILFFHSYYLFSPALGTEPGTCACKASVLQRSYIPSPVISRMVTKK